MILQKMNYHKWIELFRLKNLFYVFRKQIDEQINKYIIWFSR